MYDQDDQEAELKDLIAQQERRNEEKASCLERAQQRQRLRQQLEQSRQRERDIEIQLATVAKYNQQPPPMDRGLRMQFIVGLTFIFGVFIGATLGFGSKNGFVVVDSLQQFSPESHQVMPRTSRGRHNFVPLSYIYTHNTTRMIFNHWLQYAGPYEENTQSLRERTLIHKENLRMLEIGVQSGGSSRVWREYFGPNMQYVGADINPKTKVVESVQDRIFVEIGDQNESEFLQKLCHLYGPFDFVVDDGGHSTLNIVSSLQYLFPNCMTDKAVYAIEDLHTMTLWRNTYEMNYDYVDGDGIINTDFFGYLGIIARDLSSYFNVTDRQGNFSIAKHTSSIKIYDSMVFLHHQKDWFPMRDFTTGDIRIDGNFEDPVPVEEEAAARRSKKRKSRKRL